MSAESIDRRGGHLRFRRVGADYAVDPAAIRVVQGEARAARLDNPGVGILGLDAQRVLRDDVIHGVPCEVVGEGNHYPIVRVGWGLRGRRIDASAGAERCPEGEYGITCGKHILENSPTEDTALK